MNNKCKFILNFHKENLLGTDSSKHLGTERTTLQCIDLCVCVCVCVCVLGAARSVLKIINKILWQALCFGGGVIHVSVFSECCAVLFGNLLLTIRNNRPLPSSGVKQPKKISWPLNVRIISCSETSVIPPTSNVQYPWRAKTNKIWILCYLKCY